MRFQQEEVDSAWCSPASGRAGWGGSLAFGCPPVGWAQAKGPFP